MGLDLLGVVDVLRVSGPRGLLELLRSSHELRTTARSWSVGCALMALERHGLTGPLVSEQGLDVSGDWGLERSVLEIVCEYLYEVGELRAIAPGVYRARRPRRFERRLRALYGCLAYREPIQALEGMLDGSVRYGRDARRDDGYDAMASATLTSHFSYAFSHSLLRRVEASTLMDLGCGTGGYIGHLARHGFAGSLYGLDLSEEAIVEGRRLGVERGPVRLFAGDLFDVQKTVEAHGLPTPDVFSLMFVLHEFDDARVAAILARLRGSFPRARVLLTELADQSSDEVRRMGRTAFPELKLVHRLSDQILRTSGQWKSRFGAAGYRADFEAVNGPTSHLGLLLSPA